MPGKSKKGGGLEVDTAFYLKSGNSPLFKHVGSSPVKQKTGSIDFWNQPSRQSDVIHKAEKGIGKTTDALSKEVKKVKGKTVTISKKAAMGQAKKVGSKASWKNIKKVLKTGIKAAGKTAKFVPGVGAVITAAQMMTSKSATATQPGTGTHGGTKTGTYNPKTNKYE